MLNKVNYLHHFTREMDSLRDIFKYGFKPSYARERLDDKTILVCMVSFSNILLRDVGEKEVMFYGDYAIGFDRQWGIANGINPVNYTYNGGLLHQALNDFFYGTLFLKHIGTYSKYFKTFSEKKMGPFSKLISLTNTPKHVMDILDYLSIHYDEDLLNIISNYAKVIHDTNFPILTLTKPYVVTSSGGKEFVAYNDREWRKLYKDLDVIFEGDPDFDRWANTGKPHFSEDEYLLKFNISDVRTIMLRDVKEIDQFITFLFDQFGENTIKRLIDEGYLMINTKDNLIKGEV